MSCGRSFIEVCYGLIFLLSPALIIKCTILFYICLCYCSEKYVFEVYFYLLCSKVYNLRQGGQFSIPQKLKEGSFLGGQLSIHHFSWPSICFMRIFPNRNLLIGHFSDGNFSIIRIQKI